MALKVPKGAETVTDASGVVWYKTQGGNWRNTVTEKAQKDPSSAAPAAGAAPGAAPAGPPAPGSPGAVATTVDPQRDKDLAGLKASLGQQVASGAIQQWQADNELALSSGLSSQALGERLGRKTQAVTGAQVDAQGTPVSAPINTSTAENAIATQDQFNNKNLSQQIGVNRFDQTNDLGSSEWIIDPTTGKLTRKETLSEPQKQLLNQQQGRDIGLGQTAADELQRYSNKGEYTYSDAPGIKQGPDITGGVGSKLTSALDQWNRQGAYNYDGTPKISGSEDLLSERKRQEDLMNQNFAARNEPQFKREQESLRQSLADRGIPLTSERAKTEMSQMDQRHNDARLNAQTEAISASGSEYTNNFNTQLQNRQQGIGEYKDVRAAPLSDFNAASSANTANTTQSQNLRNQYIGEYDAQRNAPLASAKSLLELQKGVQQPTYQAADSLAVANTDVGGIGGAYKGIDTTYKISQEGNTSAENIAKMQTDASMANAGTSAGATLGAARIGAEASSQAREDANAGPNLTTPIGGGSTERTLTGTPQATATVPGQMTAEQQYINDFMAGRVKAPQPLTGTPQAKTLQPAVMPSTGNQQQQAMSMGGVASSGPEADAARARMEQLQPAVMPQQAPTVPGQMTAEQQYINDFMAGRVKAPTTQTGKTGATTNVGNQQSYIGR